MVGIFLQLFKQSCQISVIEKCSYIVPICETHGIYILGFCLTKHGSCLYKSHRVFCISLTRGAGSKIAFLFERIRFFMTESEWVAI